MKKFFNLKTKTIFALACLSVATVGVTSVSAAPKKKGAAAAPQAPLTETGNQLKAQYAAQLESLRAEILKALPVVSEPKQAALQNAVAAVANAQKASSSAGEVDGEIGKMQGVIANWKSGAGWMGRAKKKIAKAQADLAAATTDAGRQEAQKARAAAQADLAACEQRIKETEIKIAQAKTGGGARASVKASAAAALATAQGAELNAIKAILADLESVLGSDKLDAKLVKATVLTAATPHSLADFAQQGAESVALVEKILGDTALMKQMLEAGGAEYGKYGQAMQIYAAIQKASPKAKEGFFQKLALATSLEFATPIKQSNPEDQKNAPAYIDPVKRYLHYEQACLDGELDPAFKTLTVWEYRLAVNCDAPDEILTWGRKALQNYRPDHITNPNYGWRYSAAVKTEVPYGSQNVKDDLPSLHNYQNIAKDGGVCGRRAFFGRFVLRSFGIPVWGVTQHAHAALSHWTPKGWVVNLGAGFEHSWWDKDEVSLGGADFLLETQARAHEQDYWKVLRAQSVSRILGEDAYNGRKNIAGGFWSRAAHYQQKILAAQAVTLGPLGQELAEANEPEEKQTVEQATATAADQAIKNNSDGSISVPAVAHGKTAAKPMHLKSFGGGLQLNCNGGFKAEYTFVAPQAGKYLLAAKVATLQEGQVFNFAANNVSAPEVAVPYTIGMWQQTKPVEVNLVNGQNTLSFQVKDGSRGVAIKNFTLTPVK